MKLFSVSLTAIAFLAGVSSAAAQPATQMIVPFDAGSSTDVVARAMQPTLSAKLGQNLIVLNKPGASGTLGAAELARAKPDGRTIGILGMAGIAMVPHFRKLTFNLDSFDFICQIYSAPVVVMVAPPLPNAWRQALVPGLQDWVQTGPDTPMLPSDWLGAPS